MTTSRLPLQKKPSSVATRPAKAPRNKPAGAAPSVAAKKRGPELEQLAARVSFLEQQLRELKTDAGSTPAPEFFEDVVRTLMVIKASFADCRWWRLGHEMIGLEVIDPKFAGLNRVKRLRLLDAVIETLEPRPLARIMECHPRAPSEV